MSRTDRPPAPDLLRRFHLGLLNDSERGQVEEYLLAAGDDTGPVLAPEPTDPLVEALRSLGDTTPPPETAALRALILRLERLHPARHGPMPDTPVAPPTEDGTKRGAETDAEQAILAPPQQPDELGRLGNYRVLKELGAGGMGVVYLAQDLLSGRREALKVMRLEVAARPEARQRFLREARAAANLEHENVVAIYQVGEAAGAGGTLVPFIAMPLLAGETLAERLQREGALPPAEVARIGREAAAGLAAAHAAGLVHRDVKPANLWLHQRPGDDPAGGGRGQVKVLDFGLARPAGGESDLTQAGTVLGTPAYMSPEQADGAEVDGRSDLFSLGCVLYHAATGQAPFAGRTVTAVLRAVAGHHPPPAHAVRPEVPPALSAFIERLLAKNPASRPASAREVVVILHALEVGDGTTTDCPGRPVVRRRRWPLAAGLAVVALMLGALGWRLLGPTPAGTPTGAGAAASPVVEYRATVDAVIWSKAGGEVRRLHLGEPGALPVRAGDQVRIRAHVQPASFVYLLWIDSEGAAVPVYPWTPGRWDDRPAAEQRVEELDLPAQATRGYTITGGPAGMETLVLLARDTPLSAEEEAGLRRDLAGLPAQRPVQDGRAAVWFANGRVVEDDPTRRRRNFVVQEINDPVLRLQDLLRERVQPRGRCTAAVSFARAGP